MQIYVKKITNAFFFIRKRLLIIMMRTLIFLCCATVFSLAPRHAGSQNEKIRIHADQELAVDAVFDMIIAQTDYLVIYHEGLFKDFPKVQLKKGTIHLYKLLKQSLPAGDLNVIVTKDNTILIKEKSSDDALLQQQVSGTVTDQAGLPVPGATVLIKGTTTGTATNLDGYYSINVPHPEQVLVFSSLGFETQEITVGNQTTINVNLKERISELDEVTITGRYYNNTQREETGSIGKIDVKTIEKQPVNNPLSAMQGYISGVNIAQHSGIPGTGFDIEIRGQNFIGSGTDPLYIVDGVPYSSEQLGDGRLAAQIIPFGTLSPLNNINPADIETIEVLKDADATAIYGSRGANGVVIITTKKGKAGKTTISTRLSTSMASVPRSSFVELLNTEQYLEMRLEAIANDGFTLETFSDTFNNARINDLILFGQKRYTDWQEVLTGGTAYRNMAQLSFSGGNAQTQFLLSGSYQNETTVFIADSNYGKASVHNNINHQSLDKRFQVNVTTSYTADNNQLPAFAFTKVALSLPPNAPALYDENGDLNWEDWGNPLGKLEAKFQSKTKSLIMNSIISYRPIPDLEFKANLGYTDINVNGYSTSPSSQYSPDSGLTSASSLIFTSDASRQSWIVEPQLSMQKQWGKAGLNILVGVTFQQQQSNQIDLTAVGFPSDSQILNLSAASFVSVDSDQDKTYNYQSVFGRLNFKWAGKYIINLTGRRDGSSRFGPGRQFGNFGAVGAAWLFTKERLLEDNGFLSSGKFRSSYGITGSDGIEDYAFYDSYETSVETYDGTGLEPSHLFNPIFAWEENNKFEVALELGFIQNRLFLTTAWYQNRSSNQLVGVPLPSTTGFGRVNGNFDATVENTGLEIDFRSVNIQTEHFKWISTFNISVPKNKLIRFDGLESSTYRESLVIGKPISIIKLFHNTGVDPDTGWYQFEDYNNDGIIDSQHDRQWIEDRAPKFYGGLGNTLNYKAWSLDIFFYFKKHRVSDLVTVQMPGFYSNQPVSVLNRWQQLGDVTSVQRYSLNVHPNASELNLFDEYTRSNAIYTDGSFIRLRNISLTYAIPKDVVRGVDVSIYLQGQNLLTLTKYKGGDPERALRGFLPVLRQFTFGVQLGF